MARHIHRWAGAHITMLTLPAVDGTYEALKTWRCFSCGAEGSAIGTLDDQPCTITPAQWDTAVAHQRRQGTTPAAQQMAKHWRTVERGQRRLRHTREERG